jgi:hypothetical protein
MIYDLANRQYESNPNELTSNLRNEKSKELTKIRNYAKTTLNLNLK